MIIGFAVQAQEVIDSTAEDVIIKKEKKKAAYRIDTIRMTEEIDILEFCLHAIIQDINRIEFMLIKKF